MRGRAAREPRSRFQGGARCSDLARAHGTSGQATSRLAVVVRDWSPRRVSIVRVGGGGCFVRGWVPLGSQLLAGGWPERIARVGFGAFGFRVWAAVGREGAKEYLESCLRVLRPIPASLLGASPGSDPFVVAARQRYWSTLPVESARGSPPSVSSPDLSRSRVVLNGRSGARALPPARHESPAPGMVDNLGRMHTHGLRHANG